MCNPNVLHLSLFSIKWLRLLIFMKYNIWWNIKYEFWVWDKVAKTTKTRNISATMSDYAVGLPVCDMWRVSWLLWQYMSMSCNRASLYHPCCTDYRHASTVLEIFCFSNYSIITFEVLVQNYCNLLYKIR